MTATQTVLANTTLDDLCTTYALRAVRSKTHPHLISLHYNQIDSPTGHPIVRECRGIVLDESDNWRCVARSFDRFMNYGEGHADEIDWSTASVQTKLDGSLLILYYYDKAWRVATSGTPDASGMVGTEPYTFADLFWRTINEMGLDLDACCDPNLTYSFELTSPANRIVVQYPETRLTLIGIRDPETGMEYAPHVLGRGLPTVSTYPLTSVEEIVRSFDTIVPTQMEGYVVCDAAFHRVKMKAPQYVALHHLKGAVTPKALLEVARHGEISELSVAFPEIGAQVQVYRDRVDHLIRELEATYAEIRDLPTQKEYAMRAVHTTFPAALFEARKGTPISDFIRDVSIDTLLRMVEGQ